MKKGLTLIIILAAILVVAGAAYFLITSNVYTPSTPNTGIVNTTSQTPSGSNTNPSSNNPASTSHSVDISGFAFSPSSLTIAVGDTVTWTNHDTAGHSIASTGDNEIYSTILSQGQSYSHTFTKAGTFPYHCSVHPSMLGTIIVQ